MPKNTEYHEVTLLLSVFCNAVNQNRIFAQKYTTEIVLYFMNHAKHRVSTIKESPRSSSPAIPIFTMFCPFVDLSHTTMPSRHGTEANTVNAFALVYATGTGRYI